MHISDK